MLERLLAKIALKKLIKKLTKIIDEMDNSKRVTIGGVLGGLSLIITQLWYAFDGIDSTILDIGIIGAGLGMIGVGWFAKGEDKKK